MVKGGKELTAKNRNMVRVKAIDRLSYSDVLFGVLSGITADGASDPLGSCCSFADPSPAALTGHVKFFLTSKS